MKEEIRIGKAAEMIGVSVQTLRNWEKAGKLQPLRSPGGQRYYRLADINRFIIDLRQLSWAWAASAQAPEIPEEYYCERPDRFTSRLEKMGIALAGSKQIGVELASLLTVVAGEIGDNAFMHNLGNWPDVAGIFFAYDLQKRIIIIADRGQGIYKTLRRVRPNLRSDAEALHTALTEIVSGRAPEKRGNGLKVVRRIVESYPIGLSLRSGLVIAESPKQAAPLRISATSENVRGVYAVITY